MSLKYIMVWLISRAPKAPKPYLYNGLARSERSKGSQTLHINSGLVDFESVAHIVLIILLDTPAFFLSKIC